MAGEDFVSRSILVRDLLTEQASGEIWFVDARTKTQVRTGRSFAQAFATVQAAIDAAAAHDTILVAPGDYDEAVTISKANITIIGVGGRGSAFIAPTATNATGVKVTADDVTLINIGCDGDGTGPGLHLQGDVDRFRARGCKIEGDDFGARLESTAAGAVSDSLFEDCEFAWAATAFEFRVTGGGDPVTQTRLKGCTFHNFATVGMKTLTTHTADVWVEDCVFNDKEDGTQPTDFLLLDVASTTGHVNGCRFATPTNAATVLTIAAGVHWGPNGTEAGWSTARPA